MEVETDSNLPSPIAKKCNKKGGSSRRMGAICPLPAASWQLPIAEPLDSRGTCDVHSKNCYRQLNKIIKVSAQCCQNCFKFFNLCSIHTHVHKYISSMYIDIHTLHNFHPLHTAYAQSQSNTIGGGSRLHCCHQSLVEPRLESQFLR